MFYLATTLELHQHDIFNIPPKIQTNSDNIRADLIHFVMNAHFCTNLYVCIVTLPLLVSHFHFVLQPVLGRPCW